MPSVAMTPSTVGAAQQTCVQSCWGFKSRKSRVRAGRRGNNARESRGTQREQGRVPPPCRAGRSPKVPTARGQRWAAGGGGIACLGCAMWENQAVLNSTVVMRLSSPGQEVRLPRLAESADDGKPKNAYF